MPGHGQGFSLGEGAGNPAFVHVLGAVRRPAARRAGDDAPLVLQPEATVAAHVGRGTGPGAEPYRAVPSSGARYAGDRLQADCREPDCRPLESLLASTRDSRSDTTFFSTASTDIPDNGC